MTTMEEALRNKHFDVLRQMRDIIDCSQEGRFLWWRWKRRTPRLTDKQRHEFQQLVEMSIELRDRLNLIYELQNAKLRMKDES